MPGFGAIGRFPIAVLSPPEFIGPDKFWNPFSEPVRFKLGVGAPLQQFFTSGNTNPEQVTESRWHQPWSEPLIKIKQGLRTGDQQFITYNNLAQIVPFSWFNNLRDPRVLARPMLITADQPFLHEDLPPPFTFSFDWYANLSEPVRIKPGLRKELQAVEFFNSFIPIIYTLGLQTTERHDLFLAVLHKNNQPIKATVSIKVNIVPQTVSIVEPNPPPTTSISKV